MDPSYRDPATANQAKSYEASQEVWPEDRILYKGNLIYLPFARHLAEEDEAAWAKAA